MKNQTSNTAGTKDKKNMFKHNEKKKETEPVETEIPKQDAQTTEPEKKEEKKTPETVTPNFEKSEPAPDPKETELEKKIAETTLKLAEAEENRLRLLAEMDNLRKRCAKDMESSRINVTADTLMPFLQVYDHFKMAVAAAEKSDNLKTLTDGMKMIEGEFTKAFEEIGVERIDAVGKDFDPNLHEAVSQEPSETVPAGKVIRQWSCGAKLPKRLIKPAMVVVSSGTPEKK